MKILQVLNEGLLKVPANTLQQAMNLVTDDIFSRIFYYLKTTDIADDYPELEEFYLKFKRKYEKMYGEFDISPTIKASDATTATLTVPMDTVDPRYFKQNPKLRNKTFKLYFVVQLKNKDTENSGTYSPKTTKTNGQVLIKLPDEAYFKSIIRSPMDFDAFMHRVSGMVEHEFMHSIQDLAFNAVDGKVDYYDEKGEYDDDKYYGSDLEFGPQIVTAAKDFIAGISELRNAGYKVDGGTIKRLMLKFFNSSLPDVPGIKNMTNEFFDTLYRTDKPQWKKAIKYFYGLVNGKVK